MYFIFKLTFVILILYLKLNGLKTSPVIDRNKNLNNDITSNNTTNNNNNDKFVIPVAITTNSMVYTNDNYNADSNGDNVKDNANTNDKVNNNANNISNTKSTQQQQQMNTTSNLVSNNFTIIELSNEPKNYTFYPNDNSSNANHHHTTTAPNHNTRDNVWLDPAPSVKTTPIQRRPPAETTPIGATTKTSSIASEELDVVTETNDDINNDLINNWYKSVNGSDIDSILVNYENDHGDSCLLDGIKESFMWWANPNGSLSLMDSDVQEKDGFLDLSARNYSEDSDLFKKTFSHTRTKDRFVIAFSAANNQLTQAPYRTLSLISNTLKYLSLRDNFFQSYNIDTKEFIQHYNDTKLPETDNYVFKTCNNNESGILNSLRSKLLGKEKEYVGWATFPSLPQLLELDISNCRIEYVTKEAFRNMTNLRNLYMSHNKIFEIPVDTFHHVQSVRYLDLSFTNAIDITIPIPTLQAIWNLIYGLKVYQLTFKSLPNLEYLDLSHTKLTRNSAVAFTYLSQKLKFLSLCYTAFPMIGSAIFKNTELIFLDLSGNPYTSYNIIDDTFDGVRDTLKYLFFENSNIKELDWLVHLSNIRVLGLSGNNINNISLDIFSKLQSLQVLDLSSNHVGNWYNRAFSNNQKLRVLNLRKNNINIITSEMLKDFEQLEYLGIGDNDFVCDCLLREMVEIAALNNKEAECSRNVLQDAAEIIGENIDWAGDYMSMNLTRAAQLGYSRLVTYNNKSQNSGGANIEIGQAIIGRYMPSLKRSYKNMRLHNYAQNRVQLRFFNKLYRQVKDGPLTASQCKPAYEPDVTYEKLNSSMLKFQLLDYEDDHYWCFNETQRMNFVQLNCQSRSYVDDITAQLHTLTKWVLGSIGCVIGITLIGVIIYLKRWHIHYYYSSLKSAALLSVATKETVDKFNELSETEPNLVYDIFISYCQNDRQWVLDELLPNVEVADDISICMHERDFQIGLTILDNIISCMDRSKALMLIISRHFLLSHWCQFEMHLAQYRMFEASKEQLILVFLEDIPRSRRPKTLQYLMEVKTYIKWPASKGDKNVKADDKKLFWKRLKRSLENVGVNHSDSTA